VTHDHEQGIRGAQATAAAVFLARTGKSKQDIRGYIKEKFDYFLDESLDQMRPTYQFSASCQWSVPSPSSPSSNRRTKRTRFVMPSRSVGMRTPWRAL
jgi:hypothetical protein